MLVHLGVYEMAIHGAWTLVISPDYSLFSFSCCSTFCSPKHDWYWIVLKVTVLKGNCSRGPQTPASE